MKNKQLKIVSSTVALLIGTMLIILGVVLNLTDNISGAFLGIGAGLCGAAASILISIKLYNKHPQMLKNKNIEVNDERNIIIKDKAKASAFRIYTFVLSAVLMSLVFANLSSVWLFAAICLYIFRFVLEIFFVSKYMKEI